MYHSADNKATSDTVCAPDATLRDIVGDESVAKIGRSCSTTDDESIPSSLLQLEREDTMIRKMYHTAMHVRSDMSSKEQEVHCDWPPDEAEFTIDNCNNRVPAYCLVCSTFLLLLLEQLMMSHPLTASLILIRALT